MVCGARPEQRRGPPAAAEHPPLSGAAHESRGRCLRHVPCITLSLLVGFNNATPQVKAVAARWSGFPEGDFSLLLAAYDSARPHERVYPRTRLD